MNGKRPPHVKPPAYLSPSPPIPEPEEIKPDVENGENRNDDPVRYGDWVIKGIAIDF